MRSAIATREAFGLGCRCRVSSTWQRRRPAQPLRPAQPPARPRSMLFLLLPLAAWLVASGIAVDVSLVAGGIAVAWIMCHSYSHPAEAAFLTAG